MRVQHYTSAEVHARPYGNLVLLAGNTRRTMRTVRADLKVLLIAAGERTSMHRHLVAESVYHVLDGQLRLEGAGDGCVVAAGDTFIVEPGELHRLVNLGDATARVMEVESPPHDHDDKLVPGADPPTHWRAAAPGRFWNANFSVRVKVCGLRGLEGAWACWEAGADAIGIHAVGPDRATRVDDHARWTRRVPSELSVFLLTDAADPVEAIALAWRTGADTIQVQGALEPDELARLAGPLRERGWKVVKSLGVLDVPSASARTLVQEYAPHVDALLLDATWRGGAGRANDLDRVVALIEGADAPVVIAGGLHPSNVGEAVRRVRPIGVDVESGVECTFVDREGRSVRACSPRLVADFVRAARAG